MIKLEFPKKKKTYSKNNIQPDPNIYWLEIFSIGFLLTVLSFGFGLYTFIQISKEVIAGNESTNRPIEKISKERINRALDVFSVRADAANSILSAPSDIVDPSL